MGVKLTEAKTSDLAKAYIELRDRRDARKRKFTEEDKPDETFQERIAAELLRRFNDEGIESVRTPFGTAYKALRVSASVADRPTFLTYLKEHEAWDLADIRVAKNNVKQLREETGDIPPGINWVESREIGVLRGKG